MAKERLAAIGELAAVVAHEVRNPLGAVFNATDTLRRLVGEQGQTGMLLRILAEESERISHIVDDLLDFANPHPIAVSEVPLARALDEALAASLSRPGIRVEQRVAPGLANVTADSRQLRRALINLFHNAVQAMPEGGLLRIQAEPSERDGRRYIAIEIADTGPGIDRDARERDFPCLFYDQGHRDRLGTGSCAPDRRVSWRSHRGPQRRGWGCGVYVAFAGYGGRSAMSERGGESRSRILVVDDQKNMRATTALLLTHQGYTVSEAQSGPAALRQMQTEQFDLLLTDLRMEPLDGITVLRRSLDLAPGMPVLLMTAYGSIESAVEAMRLGAVDYLTKPFQPEELLIRVGRALRSPPPAARGRRVGRRVPRALWPRARDRPFHRDAGPHGACRPGRPHRRHRAGHR